MRPKLQEVAALTGVSEATVSRVMNARPGVAEPTRRLVLDALSDLGYREVPASSARSGVVGIITPELENPIFPLLAQTIESRLARHGIMSVVCPSTSETIHEDDYLDHLVDIDAAGIVVVNGRYAQAGIGYEPYERMLDKGIPTVLVNGIFPDCTVPAVSIDVAAAAQSGVQHLARLGHTKIGCLIGPRRYSTSQLLVEGYEKAVAAAGLKNGSHLISETLFTLEGGHAGMAKLLEAGATGVIAGGDLMAIGAIGAVHAWGASVPDDVSIIGLDGTPIAALTDPALTTMRQPVDRMSAAVASMIVAQTTDGSRPRPQLFRAELVVGGSAAQAPKAR